MCTVADLLPAEVRQKLETNFFKKRAQKQTVSKLKVEKVEKTLARNPFFQDAVWKGHEKKALRVAKNVIIQEQGFRVSRKEFFRVYLEATKIVALL